LSFFSEQFDGRPPAPGSGWGEESLARLENLIDARVHYFETSPGGERESAVQVTLDRGRLAELTEAWVPVRVGDRRGVIVFANSD
jgi:hypothetical protein